MAIQNKSLGDLSSPTEITRAGQIQSTHNKVVEFGTHATDGLTLPVGTLLAYNEDNDNWQPLDITAAATGGDGFLGVPRAVVYPDPIVLDDTDTVLGVVMFAGRIHWNDITKSTTYNPGYTEAKLKAAIVGDWATVHAEVATYAATRNANTLRALGITVENVPLIAR